MEVIIENQADGELCLEELAGCSEIKIRCRKVEGTIISNEKEAPKSGDEE